MFFKDRTILLLSFAALSHGSAFYFLFSSLKPFYVLSPFLIFIYCYYGLSKKNSNLYIYLLVFSFLLYTLVFAFTLDYDQLRWLDNFYLLGIIISIGMADLSLKIENIKYSKRILFFIILLLLVSLTFELFLGVSFVQKQSEFIVSSFFNNPNDLASFVIITYLSTLLFIIKTEGGFLEYTTLFLVCLVILLVTMSRTALLVFFIVSLLFACSRLKFGFLYLLLGIVAGYLFYSFFLEGILIALIDNSSELVSMNAKRIWLFLFSLDADNSVGAREEIYFAFLSNLHNATLGFGIKNYSEFFSGYNVIELSKVNPHSLLIDFSLSFGYLGAVIYFASPAYMLYLIISKKTDDLSPIFLFCAIFIYFSVSLIPSSIYRLPFFFYPFFLIMFNHTRKVRKKDIW